MLQTQASNGTSQSEKSKKFSFSGTLNSLGKIDQLPEFRFQWNSNEEVFTILTSLEEHKNWAASEVKMRPPNGSQLLYNRNNLKTRSYHNDKYFWKTRKNSKSSARVDHSSLRIRGIECIYCSYVHSALVPTFHRRCYWLLENPDIVFVHYLNIPNKTTTFDDLLTSLLPFKNLTEEELRCQLQPIFTSSQDEKNCNTTFSVDVDKLVKDVKNYEEPKTKRRGNQKRASSSSRKPQETSAKSSHVLGKCSNCNRFCTTDGSSTSSSSRTNVAVTINRQAGTSSRIKPPVSNGTVFAQASFNTESLAPNNTAGQALISTTSVVKSAIEQNVLTTNSIPHDSSHESLLSTDMSMQNNSDHYTCHNFVVSHTSNEISSNNCHGYANLPVSSEANPCVLDNNLVVLDYDGINLFQSSQLENDLSNDISFKDLVQYLEQPVPSYPSGVNDLQYDKPALFIDGAPELTTVSSSMNLGEAALCNTVMSNGIDLPSYPQCGNLVQQANAISNTVGATIGHTSYCPTDVISTDCHTFNYLISSVIHSDASNVSGVVDNPLLNSHHCPSNDQKLTFEKETHVNMFQMGFPKDHLPDVGVSQGEGLLEGGDQVNVSQFGGPPVNMAEMATGNLVVPKLAHPADTYVGSYQEGSRVGMSQPGGSKEDAFGVDTSPEVLPNVDGSTKGNPQISSLSTQGNPDLRTTGNPPGDIITEFSPEWSYCDGKTKVLILGDWSHHNGNYSCLFDGCSVPATLIPPGVLRCFCPPHDPGLVALQVAWNGFIVSNACVFEYKTRDNATNCVSDWLDTSDSDLKKLILERIERLEGILGISMSSGDTKVEVGALFENEIGTIEDRIVRICEVLLGQPGTCTLPDTETGPKGLTLLHLAAGLGYTKLIHLLQDHARAHATHAQTSVTVMQCAEWSPHSKDSFGCTPLMWACWRGHNDAAMTLLAWEPSLYSDCDHSGRSPKAIAQEMGHLDLVLEMEEFIRSEDMYSLVMETSPQSPSSSCAYLSVSSSEQVPQSPMSADSLTWERVEGVSEPSGDFEMANVISEERPNTLGKVLVEVRTLIEQAEEPAMSPLNTPNNSAPFSLGFTGFSDLNSDEGASDNLTLDPDVGPRTSQYDTLSIDSSPIRTPSSHSPGSPALRNSPQSTGTDTSEFEEFLSKPRQFLERDFSELTLTDIEQQELLQAAKVIQNAYRQFKNRKKQHIDELKAAVLIQSYYRRYKQFALYKKITKAAVVIQNSYRAHKEHEQFKRSRHAAAVIQTYFRHYRKRKQRHAEEDPPGKRLEKKYRKPSYGK